ncbi:TetR/AcrR family transcriptional regulator [Aestuariispira ectoiniformans]|uniref:TetR/AcrR family transcriptional regulator n=1 Tax=Aestuariispira ectoiniformans TaxID=2775080 RepID=UPI00223BA7A7|nr:TetR/AcrR family transcriptional regulator [Aestuariispira ectoiniformans]
MAKAVTTPRKLPKQDRSRAAVDAMLTATAQVLQVEGYDKTTTARIAERAGVSVGSLYQYFPNKDALIAALIRQHTDALLRSFEGRMDRILSMDAPPAVTLPLIVAELAGAERVDPHLHGILVEQIPQADQASHVAEVQQQLCRMLERYLEKHVECLIVADIPLAAQVMETTLEALVHRAVDGRSDRMTVSAVQQEACRMLQAYLFGGGALEEVRPASG